VDAGANIINVNAVSTSFLVTYSELKNAYDYAMRNGSEATILFVFGCETPHTNSAPDSAKQISFLNPGLYDGRSKETILKGHHFWKDRCRIII